MRFFSLIFAMLISSASANAEQVNIVCNLTRTVSDKENLNGPTSGTITASLDDATQTVLLNSSCANAAISQYNESIIFIECSDQYFDSSYSFDRISGELTWSLFGRNGGFLIHYGQCEKASAKF